MPLTAIAFWLAYAGGVCAAIAYPAAGVALYVLVYHLNPEAQWWGQSFVATGLRPSLTVALAIVLGILLRRPRFEHGARQFPLQAVLMLALAGYALFSLAWADLAWSRSLFMADKVFKLALFSIILVRCVRRPEHYHLMYMCWLVGVAYLGYQAKGGMGGWFGGRLAWGLGGADFAESSDLAVHLVASLPLIGALFFMSRSWLGRGFALGAGALAVNTIIATRTRNALVGVAAMSGLAAFWLPRGYRAKGLAAIAIGAVLAAYLTDPGWWGRMRTIQAYQTDASALNRLTFWRAAFSMAYEHPQGIGLGQFHLRVQEFLSESSAYGHGAHSTFMTCLAELGIPGSALLLSIIVVAFRRLNSIRRAAPTFASDIRLDLLRCAPPFHLGWHAMALQCALTGYLACSLFTTRLWAEGLWLLLGMTVCLQNVRLYMEATALPSARTTAYSRGEPDGPRRGPPVPAAGPIGRSIPPGSVSGWP